MKLTNTIRDAFVRAAMADVPTVDYDDQIQKLVTADAVKQLPPKVAAIYKDAALRPFVSADYCGQVSGHFPGVNFKPTAETLAVVKRLNDADDVQSTRRNELSRRLRAVAYSVTTRKALIDALPEFEKYLPVDDAAATKNLPAVANVVADFVKAGWPKTASK